MGRSGRRRFFERCQKKGMWPSIEFLINVWLKKNPERTNEFIKAKGELTLSRRNATASSKSLQRRYLCEVPPEIMGAIDIMWGSKITSKQEFWRDFAKQFPIFKVPEHI